ncbi:MAG: hypothetical protein Q9166_008099 [cf. Caloplaca sp. 2 TL-2023]
MIASKGQTVGLIAPLRINGKTGTRYGEVEHGNIIGKHHRSVVVTSKGNNLRVQNPTLEEYILLTPRLVTPIYPADANLIVSLLDLHPDTREATPGTDPAIEILEAGTGHGALTLHLARAIHAANAGAASGADHRMSLPGFWRYATCLAASGFSRLFGRDMTGVDNGMSSMRTERPCGQAVLHTVDVSSTYSKHAAKIVGGFRRGMYMRNINFEVGNVSEWIERRTEARGGKPSLSHALLDLPSSHTYIEVIASALRVDGKLLVFNPSITQINSAIERIKTQRLPLQLERVVEIGPATTGGRIWDVRFVKPRASVKQDTTGKMAVAATDGAKAVEKVGNPNREGADGKDELGHDKGWQIVCRPKVGDRIMGGGFIALWSRNKTRKDI